MRNFMLLFFSLLSISLSFAQTGPGGVGSTANIEAWLDASDLSLSDADPVTSWTDLSGNGNDAEDVIGNATPTFQTNEINGHPVIDFSGDAILEFSTNISTLETTIFSIHNTPSSGSAASPFSLSNHLLVESQTKIFPIYYNPIQYSTRVTKSRNSFSIFSLSSVAGISGVNMTITNGTNSNSVNRNEGAGLSSSTIGCRNDGSYKAFSNGEVAELIVFNEELNSAKRKIVGNYLAAKYNLTPEQSLYAFGSTHGTQVIGIGQEVDGSNLEARGLDSLQISNPSTLNNGDYLMVGNDDAGYSTSLAVGSDATQRWTQVWRSDVTGTPGTIDLTFYLGTNDFAVDPNDYVILIENIDGDFTNGGTSIQESGRIYDGANGTVTFTGISLSNGEFFTLAEKSGVTPPSLPSIDFGPGGVGSTANIEAWLDASTLSLSNTDPVTNWTDLSGNGNDADDVIGNATPTFQTNEINGHPVIDFSSDAILEFSSNISTLETTIFSVHNTPSSGSAASPFSLSNHLLVESQTKIFPIYYNPVQYSTRLNKARNSFSVFSLSSAGGVSGASFTLTNNANSISGVRNEGAGLSSSTIGCRNQTTYEAFSNGKVAELIIFNEKLNSAKRKIVSNHLAAKYNLTAEQNLYTYGSTHGTQVIGIGQEADGSHIESRGIDSLLINNPSTLSNGDYLLLGNNNLDFSVSSDVPSGIVERWNRTWRVSKTGSPGTIDVEFFLGSNGFSAISDYVVLIEEADGDFSNGGTRIHETGRSFDSGTLSITFTGLDLADGASFTLAEKAATTIASIANGNWENTTTWDCSCVPGDISIVNIGHNVTINNNESVLDINLNAGSILFGSADSLFIYGDFDNDVNAPLMAGTIIVANTIDLQTFSGTGSIEMNNLQVNASGLTVSSGDWTILNNIQVSAGSMTANGTSNVVFASSATKTSQILPSVSGAFVGDFTIERFIGARNSNYSNMASPISNATANDLDGELTLSGIGGNNGNAQATGGGTFNSMWFFDSPTDAAVAITSTSTALPSGVGFEVFLDTVPNFSATVVTYEGTPFSGSLTSTIVADQGWNLIGNPYHSFIDLGAVDKGSLSDDYWIYNSSTGSYDFITGASNTAIAPGQGFWLDKSTSGNQFINFEENDKVNNTSSAFVRKKTDPKFKLILSSAETSYSHQMEVVFDYNATSAIDELDARYLESPLKEAPAIYSKATNSDKDLIVNSLSAYEESHLISIEIYAGVDGIYSLDAENVNKLYDSYSCFYLKDKVNNEAVDLSVESSYQFETTKGTSNRFELIVSNSYIQCEKLLEDGAFTQKLDHNLELRNAYGQWYIDYTLDNNQQQVEIRILNMNGQEVKEAIFFGASNAGTYRLQNLQDLNGIYLIQVRTKDGFLNKTVKL